MAKPNYSFEKRQRELAKKKKKEEKEKDKAIRKTTGADGDAHESLLSDGGEGEAPAGESPPSA